MASEVDICNLALAHLGDEANVSAISPPDGSVQAAHCKRFYPIARDIFVEEHPWSFAVRRVSLAVLSLDPMPQEWAYAYSFPNCLRVLAVLPPDVAVTDAQGAIFSAEELRARAKAFPFNVESQDDGSRVVFTNLEYATALYIAKVTDTTKFSPTAVQAIARLLASYLAGPILKGKEGREAAREHMKTYLEIEAPRAKSSDSNQSRNTSYNDFTPSSLAARA